MKNRRPRTPAWATWIIESYRIDCSKPRFFGGVFFARESIGPMIADVARLRQGNPL
jgi:hypothetical protein